MRKPVTINIGSAGKATDNVTQHIIMAKDNDKPRLLEDWINEVCPSAFNTNHSFCHGHACHPAVRSFVHVLPVVGGKKFFL